MRGVTPIAFDQVGLADAMGDNEKTRRQEHQSKLWWSTHLGRAVASHLSISHRAAPPSAAYRRRGLTPRDGCASREAVYCIG